MLPSASPHGSASTYHFDLSTEDFPDWCVISVGAAAHSSEKCWCELNCLQGLVTAGGTRQLFPSGVTCPGIIRPALQIQWRQDRLPVLMDSHKVGLLELEPSQIPALAQATIYIFHAPDSMLPRNIDQSKMFPFPQNWGQHGPSSHITICREPLVWNLPHPTTVMLRQRSSRHSVMQTPGSLVGEHRRL